MQERTRKNKVRRENVKLATGNGEKYAPFHIRTSKIQVHTCLSLTQMHTIYFIPSTNP